MARTSSHARRFAAGLSAAGYKILNDVVINQVMVSFGTPEQTLATIARVQEDGTCWCGPTEWQGQTAMRISVSSWATSTEDVDRSLGGDAEGRKGIRPILRTVLPRRIAPASATFVLIDNGFDRGTMPVQCGSPLYCILRSFPDRLNWS